MNVSNYIVHILSHSGWHTCKARGRTFGEAAKRAVIKYSNEHGLDLSTIPHRMSFKHYATYDSVVLYHGSSRSVMRSFVNPTGVTTPGGYWFSYQVRRGKRGDCSSCGGTGQSYYNPFDQCAVCGKKNRDGSVKEFKMVTIGNVLIPADSTPQMIRAVQREQRAKGHDTGVTRI